MAKKKRKTNNRPAPKPIEYVNVAIPKNSFGENNSVKLTKMGEDFLVSEIPNSKEVSSIFSTTFGNSFAEIPIISNLEFLQVIVPVEPFTSK